MTQAAGGKSLPWRENWVKPEITSHAGVRKSKPFLDI